MHVNIGPEQTMYQLSEFSQTSNLSLASKVDSRPPRSTMQFLLCTSILRQGADYRSAQASNQPTCHDIAYPVSLDHDA